ncbi:ArsR/SmtB family transcription factor [Halalkalibacillus halophilus]|uniref:ArsR/SmtB family transcription factor n=1 Tax=Halalkalibacillus halophilus TaxID=392827 RepID=UPI0004065848|nr:metalloregulator ArsR/SmtB family transcription factor [Halalkalibacillus halophilus]
MKKPNCTSEITEEQLQYIVSDINSKPVDQVAKLFKVLGDPTRVTIMQALAMESELCVCDLASVTNNSVATTSHHLQTLKKHGLVTIRRGGKNIYYKLDDEHVRDIIQITTTHQQEMEV